MIRQLLEDFVKDVCDRGEIALADVRRLQREIMPDGVENRDEADLLVALDRAVAEKHGTWSAFATQAVVDFVVWASRPTGYVDRETASWLVASLSAGRGPTPLAEAIAFDVLREAERADEVLVAFVMRAAGGRARATMRPSELAA